MIERNGKERKKENRERTTESIVLATTCLVKESDGALVLLLVPARVACKKVGKNMKVPGELTEGCAHVCVGCFSPATTKQRCSPTTAAEARFDRRRKPVAENGLANGQQTSQWQRHN
jgi:hypothetical protein